jgi:hypothetical protein
MLDEEVGRRVVDELTILDVLWKVRALVVLYWRFFDDRRVEQRASTDMSSCVGFGYGGGGDEEIFIVEEKGTHTMTHRLGVFWCGIFLGYGAVLSIRLPSGQHIYASS